MVQEEVITVTGAEETAQFINNVASSLGSMIGEGLSQIANNIETTTRAAAPVDTGFLKSQITVTHSNTGLEARAGADYSSFVDQGTSRMSAEPFFTSNTMEILAGASAVIDGIITKQIGSNR
jgi:hypothetical protein